MDYSENSHVDYQTSFSLALAVTALVAGCSSGVKLDDKPVDGSLSSQGAGANGQGQRCVRRGLDRFRRFQGHQGVSRIVYFDFDSYSVKADAQPQIESHAKFIKANPAAKVQLEGHTDERGGREYNLALGQKRR